MSLGFFAAINMPALIISSRVGRGVSDISVTLALSDGRRCNPSRWQTAMVNKRRSGRVGASGGARVKPLSINEISCDVLDEVEPQSLAVTYAFEAPKTGVPGALPIRFTGKWVGPSYTTRFSGIANGEWEVRAQPQALNLNPVNTRGRSGLSLVINEISPGTRVGAWPAMVLLGVALGAALMLWLAARAGISWPALLAVLIVSSLVGLVGARLYYLGESRKKVAWFSTAGLCIQGFVIGFFVALVAGSYVIAAPPLEVFDFAAPGLMLGMFVGRFGCLWGGCCVGRQTTAWYGVWSSDRRIGAKRVPVQLIEGVGSLLIGAIALAILLADPTAPNGAIFVGVVAAYVLLRQLLFPLRALPRKTSWGRWLALGLAAAALIGSIAAIGIG